MWPGEGCQTLVCTLRLPYADMTKTTASFFAIILIMVIDEVQRPGSPRPGQACSIVNRDAIPALPAG